ncbi:MAG: O-antigen ligase family protein [Planctomycetales bacterium]|nr:O-antigen ligase family protein [Planctomycetales bacterium]
MRPVLLHPDALETSVSAWDKALGAILVALLVFMPLTFGAVEAWSELVVVLGAATLSTLLLVRMAVEPTFRPARTWAYLPLVGILALGALQLANLPDSLATTLAPRNMAVRSELLADQAAQAALQGEAADVGNPISLAPYATAHDLRLALVFVAIFCTVAAVCQTSRLIKLLLAAVFIIGCVEASLALLQTLTLTKAIYWGAGPESGRVVTSGSFINYSHFSQFTNLSLGAGVALLLVRMLETQRSEFGERTPFDQLASWGTLNGWIMAGVVLCALAVLLSMSRNGAMSLFVAAAIVALLLFRSGGLSAKGWLLGMIPWCVLAVLFIAGFDTVYDRLASLEDGSHLESRVELTQGVLRAWRDMPVFGAGLGAHEYVFPMYDSATTPIVAAHADDDWAQLLEEFGTVGFLAVTSFIACIGWTLWRLMSRGRAAVAMAAYGLTLGFVATAIHALSDFGQHLPAVFSLTAVCSGLAVAVARLDRKRRPRSKGARSSEEPKVASRSRHLPANVHRGLAIGTLAVTLPVWWWAVRGAYAAHIGEAYWGVALHHEDLMQTSQLPPTDEDWVNLLTAAEGAVAADPLNPKYSFWLNDYRWQAMPRTQNEETGAWELPLETVPHIERIADGLAAGRTLAPTFGPPYALEGQLRLRWLSDSAGAELIKTAYRLSPYDPLTCLAAGELMGEEGDMEGAHTALLRAATLDGRYFADAVEIVAFGLGHPELIAELAGNDYRRLDAAARQLARDESLAETATALRERSRELLFARAAAGDATAYELAAAANFEIQADRKEEAVALYRRALGLNYGQVAWRIRMAELLVDLGRTDEAVDEARKCLRLKPKMARAENIVGKYGR